MATNSSDIRKLWIGGFVGFIGSALLASFSTYIALTKDITRMQIELQLVQEVNVRQDEESATLQDEVEDLKLASQSSRDSINYLKDQNKSIIENLEKVVSKISSMDTTLKVIESTIARTSKKK